MTDVVYKRYGDVVAGRLQAFGIPGALSAALSWCRRQPPTLSAHDMLVGVTLLALERGPQPDERELAPYLCSAAQLNLVLKAADPIRLALILVVMDGIDSREAARLAGVSPTKLDQALARTSDARKAAARPVPEGSQPDGHPSTLLFEGYALQELAPMQSAQLEQHLTTCTFCFQRFEAWSAKKEWFDAHPLPSPPVPKKERSLTAGLTVGLLLLAFLACAGAGSVGVVLLSSANDVDVAFVEQPATLQLFSQEQRVFDVSSVPDGGLLSVRIEAHGAQHMAIALREPTGLQVLFSAKVPQREGFFLAPVDLVHVKQSERTLYVLLGSRPIPSEAVEAAVSGGTTPGVSVALLKL